MSDTFHGRSPESLIEEIRELSAFNDMLVSCLHSVADYLNGEVDRDALIGIVSSAIKEHRITKP